MSRTEMDQASIGDIGTVHHCSFCGKSQHEVRKMIAGPTVSICNECVDRFANIDEGNL